MAYSDKEILESIRKGQDDKVLGHLYATVFPAVKQYIHGNSGDVHEAKDIFQDAIIIFYKHVKLQRFDDSQAIGGFIYTVSRNLWINYYTRVKAKKTELSHEEDTLANNDDVLSDMLGQEREQQVMQVFASLGDRCKDLLVNTVFHKLSMKDICEKMGFSTENSAKTQHYKCKQRLIELIDKHPTFKQLLQ